MVSTRQAQNGKRSDYKIGDKVEILRADGIAVGVLIRRKEELASSSTSVKNVPHWFVSLEKSNLAPGPNAKQKDDDEEEVSEHMLGRILDDTVENAAVTQASSAIATSSNNNAVASTGENRSQQSKISNKANVAAVKAAPLPRKGNRPGRPTKNANKKPAAAKAKFQRGKRARSPLPPLPPSPFSNRTRAATRSSDTELLKGIEEVGIIHKHNNNNNNNNHNNIHKPIKKLLAKKRPAKAPTKETKTVNRQGETVTKIKMQTGILYLYRDINNKRRAEFVFSK